ncbi:drebrin-like protein B isoform X2 [Salmo salar]|uniref:Drebrin like n=2 Tax=Salmo TaxID=8028 RepID=A0A674EXG5_SALTR|nr:drebrin-like b isoform X2 [Salmo salar]XP_029572919.1 drebrin-like protein B isoform X1 [Salmo trutta]|eukprot:XP_014027503.1 PREDICTED: drebrin-like protein isoform X3 [Salmo salar]
MAVNLSKNGIALTNAYKEVVDEKSNTNWALYTYEGNTNDIRLAEKGDGGLEELVEELSSGKIMYAFCRVQDPNSGLCKYVLINWTGEGVKDARKGLCANHVSSMANFLKGAHVTINARAEEDVEPEAIMQKVGKASGANYSFHKESNKFRDAGPQGPVGSVYQKTNAMSEIKRTNKDNFWAQAEKDEEKRRQEERCKADEERQKLEKDRKDREAKEATLREKRDKERASMIDQQKKYQQQQEAESREDEKQQWEEQEKDFQATQKKGMKRGESVEKANEAASLISQRSMNPREMFKQREKGMDTPAAAAHAPASPQPEPVVDESSQSECLDEQDATPVQDAVPEEQWQDEVKAPAPPTQHNHPTEPAQNDLYEEPPQVEENTFEVPAGEKTDQGVCARALYDYQAADDTEISFDPDDIITGIEMIDEGWWRGYSPDGHFGMFPANYVEVI